MPGAHVLLFHGRLNTGTVGHTGQQGDGEKPRQPRASLSGAQKLRAGTEQQHASLGNLEAGERNSQVCPGACPEAAAVSPPHCGSHPRPQPTPEHEAPTLLTLRKQPLLHFLTHLAVKSTGSGRQGALTGFLTCISVHCQVKLNN